MVYLIEWLALISLTLLVSLAGFLWAVKTGQFQDQKRVGYFPLIDLPPAPGRVRPVRRTAEFYVLAGCALLVCTALVLAVLFGLRYFDANP